MKIWNKSLSLGLSFIFFLSSLPLAAQERFFPRFAQPKPSWGNPFSPAPSSTILQPRQPQNKLLNALQKAAFTRQTNMTVQTLLAQFGAQGHVDGAAFTAVISDVAYIKGLSAEEASSLVYMAMFVDGNGNWDAKLLDTVFAWLGDYNEKSPDFALQSFYEMTAVALGHHPWMWKQVLNRAFEQVEVSARPGNTARRGWSAALLADLATDITTDMGIEKAWTKQQRDYFELKLEQLIRKFNWMQNDRADYKMRGIKNVLGATNQGVLISLFAQANSFFSMKDDDGILKQMVSAGGLNPVFRAAAGKETADRFSDTGESFYLHSPTPGTDGNGHFVDSPNGRRHFILGTLVQALFLSYDTRSAAESSSLMQQFVRQHLQTDREGHFRSYLYIPLTGMRLGAAIHFAKASLDGWDKEQDTLQKELYSKLKKGYPWNVVCTGVQGACEVTAEWIALGKLFSGVFRAMGWGAKAAGRQVIKVLPAKTLMNMALVQIAAQQGKKAVIRWSRQSIKAVLQKCGWKRKAAVVGGGLSVPGKYSGHKRQKQLSR